MSVYNLKFTYRNDMTSHMTAKVDFGGISVSVHHPFQYIIQN